jgi:hypothetical protein
MTDRELMIDCPRCGHCCPQPNQEPVKELDFWALFDENQRLRAELKFNTTPPQQWVGLTDKDRRELAAEQHSWEGLCSAVETKLREKNT